MGYTIVILHSSGLPTVFSPEFCKQRVKVKIAKGITEFAKHVLGK